MENRRKVIEEVCLREGLGRFAKKSRKQIQHPPTPNYEAFYFDRSVYYFYRQNFIHYSINNSQNNNFEILNEKIGT